MSNQIKIKKGLNINLVGEAEKVLLTAQASELISIRPSDFIGVTPKLEVKQGDEVKAGTVLFFDKDHPEIKFTSPVSGEVVEIERGDKRKLLSIKILADKELNYENFNSGNVAEMSREQIVENLLKSGAWPFIRQRPFNTIANPTQTPKSIFISGFDSAPLGPDYDFIVHNHGNDFQSGLDVLKKLTKGKVHLNLNADAKPSGVFTNAKGVQINYFSGPHPAGNVGVQIHHIDPLNKGEVVWVCNPQDVLLIGKLFQTGKFDASRIVAVTGSEAPSKKYFKTIMGSSAKSIIGKEIDTHHTRIISGNVLTGKTIQNNDSIGFYDSQLTLIPEGHEPEFLGWIAPGFDKFSLSKTFFSWLTPNKKYNLNTNQHGEERAFVVSGEYEKVLPMDIYPVYLLKAALAQDIEKMESLGIYEVVEEDFALCEYVCTSKIAVQDILRSGLDLVKKELS